MFTLFCSIFATAHNRALSHLFLFSHRPPPPHSLSFSNTQRNSRDRLTEDDIREIRDLARNEKVGEMIVGSIAPSIFGCEDVKRTCALAMFGGQGKTLMASIMCVETSIVCSSAIWRGQIAVSKYIEKTAPRTVYATGKGATAVGLTVAVHRDPVTKVDP